MKSVLDEKENWLEKKHNQEIVGIFGINLIIDDIQIKAIEAQVDILLERCT